MRSWLIATLALGAGSAHAEDLATRLHACDASCARAPDHVRSASPAYLARFSNGPRRVPQPHGAAKALADKLGIGSSDTARGFLGNAAGANLRAAAQGAAPRQLLWPVVDGRFGRGFGFTRRVRRDLPHNGVDIGAPQGTVVRAAADGLVVYSDNGLRGFGNCVMVLHKNGWLTLYAHNLRTTVQAGYQVKRGERIALVGQTGYAWGPHLHFELRDNGRLRDPLRLFVGQRSLEVSGPLVKLQDAPGDPQRSTVRGNAQPPGTHAAANSQAPRMPGRAKAAPALPASISDVLRAPPPEPAAPRRPRG
jgi:murein DD-endopeptidase MepM/ murein hydrolase activator NlpD